MTKQTLTCACGGVALELHGAPFFTTECHCDSCREAASRLARLKLSRHMVEDNGGSQFALYRKDRARIVRGQEKLVGYRLKAGAPTRRVVAGCCNSPVFLEFQGGHWLSIYSSLWPEGQAPRPQIRTMTADRHPEAQPDQSIPHGKRQTFGFYGRLLAAWVAMGFRSPRFEVGREAILE